MRRRALAAAVGAATCIAALTPVAYGYRTTNYQSATMGDIRSFISAEAAYQSANRGWYDKPECLHRPEQCIPGYAGHVFLVDPKDLLPAKNGYHREFHPGPAVAPALLAGASPSSLETWACVALPEREGTALRGLCGDSTGAICWTPRGGRPAVSRGACVIDPRPRPSDLQIWIEGFFRDRPETEPCYPFS